MEFLAAAQLWIKAFHVIAVMFWMAALYYLPRLFVYHAECGAGSPQAQTFKVMERRLLQIIATPAMLAAWGAGLLLLAAPGAVDWAQGWIYAKLALVLGLSALHGVFMRWQRQFAQDGPMRPPLFYRRINEIAPLITILVVILAVVRPF